MLFRNRSHRLVEGTIDTVFHTNFRISCFNMNVTGAPLECCKDDGVEEPDDRTGFPLRDLLNGDGLFAAFVFPDQIELEPLRRFLQHALRRFGFLQQVLNFRKRRDLDDQRASQQR